MKEIPQIEQHFELALSFGVNLGRIVTPAPVTIERAFHSEKQPSQRVSTDEQTLVLWFWEPIRIVILPRGLHLTNSVSPGLIDMIDSSKQDRE
jgi:hypothetical protein